MGDFSAVSAASNTELGVPKEPKVAISHGCCDVAAALNNGVYAEQLLEMHEAVQNLGGSFCEADGAIGLKFLLDCSLKPEKAAKKFVQSQKWRASYTPLGYIPDSEVSSFLVSESVAMAGKSRNGWPVLIIFAGKGYRRRDVESTKRFLIYILDKAMASGARAGRLLVIMDLKLAGLKTFDLNQLVLGFQVQQKHYPGVLGKMYMVNAPKFFINAWKLITPLLSKTLKEKIVFMDSQEVMDVLLSEMDVEVIPKMYGGKGELVLLQNVEVPNLGSPAD